MNHLDYCTHWQFADDRDILTRPNFDVNIRLLRRNKDYKLLIEHCCEYIKFCAETEKDGYKKPHGWSGANAGIPVNIIAFVDNDSTYCFINPKITKWSGVSKEVFSNCGSLTFPEKVRIARDSLINVGFYTLTGAWIEWIDVGPVPGYTIQHEIAHTNGILLRNR